MHTITSPTSGQIAYSYPVHLSTPLPTFFGELINKSSLLRFHTTIYIYPNDNNKPPVPPPNGRRRNLPPTIPLRGRHHQPPLRSPPLYFPPQIHPSRYRTPPRRPPHPLLHLILSRHIHFNMDLPPIPILPPHPPSRTNARATIIIQRHRPILTNLPCPQWHDIRR